MARLPTVLLVEDNEDDAILFRRGVRARRIRAKLRLIADGHEAIRYLSGAEPYANRLDHPLPGLVILDLHIRGSSGLAVLRWIRKQETLAGLPVVVFTGTDHGASIEEAMQSGADTYLLKGHDMEGLLHLLEQADLTWTPRKQSDDLQTI